MSPWEGPAQAWVARLMLPEAHGPQATPPWLLVSYGPASCICDLPASCDFQAPPCKPDVGGRWGSGCVLAPWGPWASGGGVLSSRPARESPGDGAGRALHKQETPAGGGWRGQTDSSWPAGSAGNGCGHFPWTPWGHHPVLPDCGVPPSIRPGAE